LYQVSTFFLNNAKGDIYKIVKGIVWNLVIRRKKRIDRKSLSIFGKCHIDTVSSANIRLEEAGLFQIGRQFKKPNIYETEFLDVLSYFFGYSVNFLLSSASLLDLTDNINIYIDLKETRFWISHTEDNTQKGNIQENLQDNTPFMSQTLRNSIPILCPEKAKVQCIEYWNTPISEEERFAFREELKKQLGMI